MSKNIAGDAGFANGGIRVGGNNGAMSENVSKGNSLVSIRVTSTGHKLSKKRSGRMYAQNNGSCQFVVALLNSDGGPSTSTQ